jgi:hypothetical protein
LEPVVSLCCSTTGNTIQATAGSDLCSTNVGVLLPTFTQLKATSVTYTGGTCTTPTLTAVLGGHSNASCNGTWTMTEGTTTAPAGC